jgi:ferredoxin
MSELQHARVRVDTNLCVGSGTCAMVDPQHFELVDGKARASEGTLEVTEDLADAILDCPVQAISRSDD